MDDSDRQDLHEGMRIVGAALSGAGIPFALAGGFAAWVHGAPQSEHDADFVIREQDRSSAWEALSETELRVVDPVENWLFKAYKGEALVDIIFRLDGEPVPDAIFERADSFDVFGVPMPVMQATDILSEKMRVLTEQRCNFSDLLPVARALREQVDWAEVATRIEGNPYAEAFLFLLDQLEVVEHPARTGVLGRGRADGGRRTREDDGGPGLARRGDDVGQLRPHGAGAGSGEETAESRIA
ncbi:hypothetical protein KZX45_15900 [Georgenia sp. EYE_87]|uniref:hypothetical protein n=1 Tax=Georgenia sp. EYE_87 TaxID=2853448 RepID=UPI002005D063|nr:hypothetical protein [Georgenia sp. EYE_87]MCK6212027.1 hypothetical protein [Georgenia sp. EYE_87]